MRHKDAHTQMLYELEQLQTELSVQWLGESLPTEWSGMEGWEPVAPHRTRVTLRLDSDMVRWFRKLGPGYQTRLNRVLRVYWTALLSGQIKGYPNDNTVPRILNDAHQMIDEMRADRAAREKK
ncbi:BrnA antitoxin family protein [Sulfitobacter sp. SK012]|uniref:BrnA antitoxin family protein n=1 Tax=Sulfitobacter sp. SK012 TaxID=1389005 RepID=UPI001C1F6145|nr:BrnA antitoxin family protein [Sulfitobacter sp. SK012]